MIQVEGDMIYIDNTDGDDAQSAVKTTFANVGGPITVSQVNVRLRQQRPTGRISDRYEYDPSPGIPESMEKALAADDAGQLRKLMLQDHIDVNHCWREADSLFMATQQSNAVKCMRLLIDHGVLIERTERKYNALFHAAQEGRLTTVNLLLKYGANLTGEFDFNKETAWSIAAFKLLHCLIHTVDHELAVLYPDNQWQPLISSDEFRIPFEELNSYCAELSATRSTDHDSPWVRLANDGYDNRMIVPLCVDLCSRLLRQTRPANSPLLAELSNRHQVFSAVHEAYVSYISTEQMDVSDEEKEVVDVVHRVKEMLPTPNSFPGLTRKSLQTHLHRLNEELKTKPEADVDWTQYPKLYICQYRGIHYFTNHFPSRKRRAHRKSFHLNRLSPAGCVYYMLAVPISVGNNFMLRESEAAEKADVTRNLFDRLQQTTMATIPQTRAALGRAIKPFQSELDRVVQGMANDYQGHQRLVKQAGDSTYQQLNELKMYGYPCYASSDLPIHALRYGYGLKPIKGLVEFGLRPEYDHTGRPRHSYLGKVYLSILSPLQMRCHHSTHVAGAHNRQFIQLKWSIAPERETSFPGGIEAECMFYEELLTVPDFSVAYQDTFLHQYGLSLQQFNQFQDELRELRGTDPKIVKWEEQLLTCIGQHKEKQLLGVASAEAANRNGYLIYRHYEGEYGVDPEKMRQQRGSPKLSRLEIRILEPAASQGNGDEHKEATELKQNRKKLKRRSKGKR